MACIAVMERHRLFRKHGPGRCGGGAAICLREQLERMGSAWG